MRSKRRPHTHSSTTPHGRRVTLSEVLVALEQHQHARLVLEQLVTNMWSNFGAEGAAEPRMLIGFVGGSAVPAREEVLERLHHRLLLWAADEQRRAESLLRTAIDAPVEPPSEDESAPRPPAIMDTSVTANKKAASMSRAAR